MRNRSPKWTYTVIAIALSLALFLALVLWLQAPAYVAWLIAASVVLFALYGYDKTQAKAGGGRVPEIVLHGLALLGGFVGGWIGMFAFHHKTQKPMFKVVLAIATVLNVAVIYFLYFR